MSSSVFFKFKSQKEPSRVEFEGTGISVFELKRDIIVKSGLGDGADFDLAIFNEDGKEEYDDDTAIIPRSTTVVARRLPAIKRGQGRAARYMTGKMPTNSKNSTRKEHGKPAAKAANNGMGQMNAAMTEEERLQAMFQAQSEQWEQTKEEMAKQTKVHVTHKKTTDNEPPVGYVCYRCGETGHYIKECPTNDDPNFETKPRLKRTTGIPRSFLKTVEKPNLLRGDGTEDTKLPSGIMVNAEGQFVVAEPDKKSWEQFQAKTKSSAAALKAAEMGDKDLKDRGLECPIDKKIFLDPMKTPCCEKTYCSECITNALIENDLVCPNCQTDGVLMDDLKEDHETTKKIAAYLDEKNAALKKARSKSPSVKPESPPPASSETSKDAINKSTSEVKAKSKSPPPVANLTLNGVKSPAKSPPTKSSTPTPKNTTSTTTDKPLTSTTAAITIKPEQQPKREAPQPPTKPNPKKRPADELLENPKIPKGPKAMQQQASQKLLQQQQAQTSQMMPGFPNMGYGMPNQFYGNGYGGMPGMGGMNMPMGNMGMMNGYPMGMMGIPNMGMMGGGYPTGNFNGGGNMYNGNGNGYGGGMGMNVNGGVGGMGGAGGQFPNQQKTIFAEPLPNEEDNAYFRKPVNPHRHQGRVKRQRPSDYREL